MPIQFCEKSRSGRLGCRTCRQKISKDVLRIGLRYENDDRDSTCGTSPLSQQQKSMRSVVSPLTTSLCCCRLPRIYYHYHLECWRFVSKKTAESFEGYSGLSAQHQALVDFSTFHRGVNIPNILFPTNPKIG